MDLSLYVPRRSTDIRLAHSSWRKDPSTIKKDSAKKMARTILKDLAKIPEAFFLCSIGTVTYKLGKLKGTTYMEVTMWWRGAERWPGLPLTMRDHSVTGAGELRVTLSRLLQFLGRFPDQPL